MWGISPATKYPEEAWAWFDWLYSVDAGKRWTQQFNEDLSVFPQADDPSQIKFKPFAQYVATEKLALFQPYPALKNAETAFVIQAPIKPDVNDVIAGIYTGQIKDIPTALAELSARYQVALNTGIQQAQQQGHKVSINDYIFPDWDATKPYTLPAS